MITQREGDTILKQLEDIVVGIVASANPNSGIKQVSLYKQYARQTMIETFKSFKEK